MNQLHHLFIIMACIQFFSFVVKSNALIPSLNWFLQFYLQYLNFYLTINYVLTIPNHSVSFINETKI